MRRDGVPGHVIAEYEKRSQADAYEVWPENWPLLDLFLALKHQWRYAGMDGQRVGLDYTAVPVVMDMLDVPKRRRRQWFAWIQMMEHEALQVFNSK
jgi:hypothetical protein